MTTELKGIENLDDKARMDELINFINIQLSDENDPLALMSNISSFIFSVIKDLNWAGFYLLKENQLVLGPFQGLPACTRLNLDKGVCAKAFREGKTIKVDNVHEFKDHIACDSNSKSELVVPLFYDGRVYGVLDIDSRVENRFTDIELEGFAKIGKIIEKVIYSK